MRSARPIGAGGADVGDDDFQGETEIRRGKMSRHVHPRVRPIHCIYGRAFVHRAFIPLPPRHRQHPLQPASVTSLIHRHLISAMERGLL